MKRAVILLPLVAAVLALAGPAAAACLDDADALAERIEAMAAEAEAAGGRKTSDGVAESTAEVQATGLALTGDPVNPFPPQPTTAEAPRATPTAEEATGVMPGADPSVALLSEDAMIELAALRDEAVAAAEAGDEAACEAALEEARAVMAR